jgi:queuine tRNA-ribosyltransferase
MGATLLSTVNLFYYQDLMAGIRTAVAERRFEDFHAQTREGWARGDIPPR